MTANPKPMKKNKSPKPQSRRAVEFSSWKGTWGIEQGLPGAAAHMPLPLALGLLQAWAASLRMSKNKGKGSQGSFQREPALDTSASRKQEGNWIQAPSCQSATNLVRRDGSTNRIRQFIRLGHTAKAHALWSRTTVKIQGNELQTAFVNDTSAATLAGWEKN